MEVTGKIKMIGTTNEVGTGGFKKRDIVVTTDEQYPQHILVQFVQDKCDLLNSFQVGEPVKIDINLRGREWTNPQGETVYFNAIQGWRIGKLAQEVPPSQQYVNNQPQYPQAPSNSPFLPNNTSVSNEEEADDLPY